MYLLDYVLVYEDDGKDPSPQDLEKRRKFLENLEKSQLEFEEVFEEVYFIKLKKKAAGFVDNDFIFFNRKLLKTRRSNSTSSNSMSLGKFSCFMQRN